MTASFLAWLGHLFGHDRPLRERLLSREDWDAQHRRLDDLEASIRMIEDYSEVWRPPPPDDLPDDLDRH